ncbi:aggregation-promoting factor C-terminal-like domain-containing protein [Agromyces bauzanensis]
MRNTNRTTHAPETHDPNNSTPTSPATPSAASRREIRRRRTGRRRLVVAGAIAAAGLVVGTGFTVQSAVATQARIEATQALNYAGTLHGEQVGAYRAIAAARILDNAEDTITVANATLAAAEGKVDASGLAASVASLSDYRTIPVDEVADLAKATREEAERTAAAAAAWDKAQAEAAAAAAAAAAAEQAAVNTPDGARAFAADLAASQYGWGAEQFQCLDSLWQKESGWSYTAYNASSGATGIPQALPGSKMATAGADWQTNARTQITWGLGYIASAYGTPCSAWSHSQAVNWY